MDSSSNSDLFVDDAYLMALLNEEPLPISDEKYAQELTLQEALYSSSSNPQKTQQNPNFPFTIPKQEIDEKPLISQGTTEIGESSQTQIISSGICMNYKNSQQNPSFSYTIPKEETGESSQTQIIFCGICMDYKESQQIFKHLKDCNHKFCTDCITKYIASKINQNISLVECPETGCTQVIEPENCSSILPKDVFGRWETALFEAMIPGYQKFYCPYKDCSVFMVDDGGVEVRESECPNCNRLFCGKCQVKWHVGVTCEEYEMLEKEERESDDLMVFKLAKDKKWRRCPSCKFFVEKSDGCHHMSCRCRYEFCYQCGVQWSNTHQSQCLSMNT